MLPHLALSIRNRTGWPNVRIMYLGGVSVFGSFAARYSNETALRGNTRNIWHKQTPSRYDGNIVECGVKNIHSLTS